MLLLKHLGVTPEHPGVLKGAHLLLDRGFREEDGGIALSPTWRRSETCVTGMVLSITCAFGLRDTRIDTLVRLLLDQQMPDGGWNCQRYRHPGKTFFGSVMQRWRSSSRSLWLAKALRAFLMDASRL